MQKIIVEQEHNDKLKCEGDELLTKVYLLNIRTIITNDMIIFANYHFSEERIQKINDYVLYDEKKRCFFSELLLRIGLCKDFGIKNENIKITRDMYGKPKLDEKYHIYYNISHSDDWVVCIISNQKVGIDIEKIRPIASDKLIDKILTVSEKECVNDKKELKFFEYWTLKEAYSKQIGKGLSIGFKNINFGDITNSINVELFGRKDNEVTFGLYRINDDYIMAICIDKEVCTLEK